MDFKKVIRPFSIIDQRPTRRYLHPVFCKIQYERNRLSITGVEHPRKSGNCWGNAGQIDSAYQHRNPEDNSPRSVLRTEADLKLAPGWTYDLWLDFLDIWKQYHLNDLSPACEHQREREEFKPRQVEVPKAEIDFKTHWNLVREAEKAARRAYAPWTVFVEDFRNSSPPHDLSLNNWTVDRSIAILNILNRLRITWIMGARVSREQLEREEELLKWAYPEGLNLASYVQFSSETKSTANLRASEFPGGLIGLPCPVCGYEYGNGWKTIPVPESILQWLQDLPDADQIPPWV